MLSRRRQNVVRYGFRYFLFKIVFKLLIISKRRVATQITVHALEITQITETN